jgi:hypothetical protein
VANDRVRPAPVPRDLPEGIILAPPVVQTTPEEGAEYVVERLLSHGRSTNDEMVIRVRWAGYSEADDSWEKAEYLPLNLVKAYAKRKKVSLSELGLWQTVWYKRFSRIPELDFQSCHSEAAPESALKFIVVWVGDFHDKWFARGSESYQAENIFH